LDLIIFEGESVICGIHNTRSQCKPILSSK
jgi:hypothetical protein